MKGVIWCGGNVQGPPGFVHGECLSAVLDESMGVLVFAHMSNFQVTKVMSVRFKHPVPISSVALITVSDPIS